MLDHKRERGIKAFAAAGHTLRCAAHQRRLAAGQSGRHGDARPHLTGADDDDARNTVFHIGHTPCGSVLPPPAPAQGAHGGGATRVNLLRVQQFDQFAHFARSVLKGRIDAVGVLLNGHLRIGVRVGEGGLVHLIHPFLRHRADAR